MNNSGFKMNSNARQGALDSFITNRVKANIPKRKRVGGIGQDPVERQAVGSMNSAMGNTLQKYKKNFSSDGYDSQIDAQQQLQDAGGELNTYNPIEGRIIEGKRAGEDNVSRYKRLGDRAVIGKRAGQRPYGAITKPVETPKNTLSETLMRYLQGMFNGGF